MNKMILRAKASLANKKAEVYVSKVVWILATIIVGMLLMWGVYEIFSDVVLPNLETNIDSLFTKANTNVDMGNDLGYEVTP